MFITTPKYETITTPNYEIITTPKYETMQLKQLSVATAAGGIRR